MKWSPDPSSYFYAHLSGTVSYRNRPISSQTWTVPCKFSTVVYRAKTNHLWKKRIFPWKNSTALFKKRADHILYHMNDWTKIFLQNMENISILVHDSKSTKRLKFLGGHHSIKCFFFMFDWKWPIPSKEEKSLQRLRVLFASWIHFTCNSF